MLPGGIDTPNLVYLSVYGSISANFYGSGLFTSVDKVEVMFTKYKSIISDNIEKITYGGTPVSNWGDGFTINAKSATEISLNIPNMGGELKIDDSCISLSKINISNSGFYGSFNKFPNLQEMNISGVDADTETIYIGGSDFLKGENITISGSDENHKTKLQRLEITGVSGNFNCENTSIQYIYINNADRNKEGFDSSMLSEFSIVGDSTLTSLTLFGFRKVSITSCNNLEELIIDDALEELYIDLMKIDKNEKTSKLKKLSNGTSVEDGVFDFTNYLNLKKVTLKNCDNLEYIKLPDRDILTDGMSDNEKLKWIDTGILPSFHDKKSYPGVGKYAGVTFPSYTKGYKLILCSGGAFRNCPNYAMLRKDWDKCEDMAGIIDYIAYTNITVSEDCTSLNDTFLVNNSISEDKDLFVMDTAIRFIEKCVPDTVKEKIVSLAGCFRGRKKVVYTMIQAAREKPYENSNYEGGVNTHPILKGYKSLNNISGMYYGTGVTFVSKNLLDLPYDQNVMGNTLVWDSFIQGMTKMQIASDALYNISYRLNSYSYTNFSIFEYDSNTSSYELVGKEKDDVFNICDFFYPFDDGKKTYTKENGCEFSDDLVPYEHITKISSLNFGDQYLDFRGMFKLFPNVQELSLFLNGCDLGNYNIDGILQPCKNITSISQCFCERDINTSTQVIDLYNLFNWKDNTTDVVRLFEGPTSNYLMNGFEVKKTITYDHFREVLEKISDYKLTRLTNIFSYCTITGYSDHKPIKFEKLLTDITNVSNLFNGCTSDYIPFADDPDGDKGIYKGGVLNIGRSFFENLPNVTLAYRTFKDTYLMTPLTYDFFCKRNKVATGTKVFLSADGTNEAMLYEHTYNSNMINLEECFNNTKFVDCRSWFDPEGEDNIAIERNYININGVVHSERGFEYYVYNKSYNTYEKHILDNDIIDDCLDNYTDFVPMNSISYKSGNVVWYNHDLNQDFMYYGNIKGGKKPFDPEYRTNINTIQETYCCLPPDFFYGCTSSASVSNIFANSNISGVIPRNLTKKIKGKSTPNIFKNVNIMPNLEYYYDEKGSLNDSILNKIDLPVDVDGSVDEYTVVFRDEYGKLQRRKPVSSDRNLGQFVYVPANYTTSGNLMSMFNFRYNLPCHWRMDTKPDGHVGYYKTTKEFNNAIESGELKLPYHSQYYFLTDKCVDWNELFDVSYLFISSDQDIDFSNKHTMGHSRSFYDISNDTADFQKYSWSKDDMRVTSAQSWTNNIIERFYIDLNLCGKKNDHNMLVDNGCPIIIKNKSVVLDSFVSGILTTFLNGRIFSKDFEVGDLTTINHKNNPTSNVIEYNKCGKNIILPKFNVSMSDDNFEFIPIDKENIYYDFMLDGDELSKRNYDTFIVRGRRDIDLFDSNYNKYTFM